MPTVAHIVQKQVRALPQLEQFIERDLVSFHRLARHLRPLIERELGKEVEEGAIVMALSRLREKLGERKAEQFKNPAWEKLRISLRDGAVEIDIQKTPSALAKAQSLQSLLKGGQQDIFSLVSGQYELTVITSAEYEKPFLSALKGEKILHVERDLSLIYLLFPSDVLYQPGFFDRILRELVWEDINVFELVSTLDELILAIRSEQAARAYDVLRTRLEIGKSRSQKDQNGIKEK